MCHPINVGRVAEKHSPSGWLELAGSGDSGDWPQQLHRNKTK